MTKGRRRRPSPPESKKAVDLSKVAETSATRGTAAVREVDSTAGTGTEFTDEISADEFLGRHGPRTSVSFALTYLWHTLGLIVIVAAVIWAAVDLTIGLNDVENKVDTVSDKVNALEAVSNRNEVKLDLISEAVTQVGREVSKTKDLVNQSRVEQAGAFNQRQIDRKSEEGTAQ